MYKIISTVIYLIAFVTSFYGLSSIQFEKFCNVKKPAQVQILLLCLSFALAYPIAQFLMLFVVN